MYSSITFRRIKMVVVMIFSFCVVFFGAPYVFINDSPRIRSEIKDEIILIPTRLAAYLRNPFRLTDADNEVETYRMQKQVSVPSGITYRPTSKTTATGTDKKNGNQYVRLYKGTVVETYIIQRADGRKIRIYIPD